MEEGVGLGALLCQSFRGLVGEPLGIAQVVRAGRAIGQGHFVIRFTAQKSPSVWNWSKFPAIGARSPSIMYLQLLRRNDAPSQSADWPGQVQLWCVTPRGDVRARSRLRRSGHRQSARENPRAGFA